MRRLLAMLLMALTCFSLVEPLFALDAGVASRLPACCRRNGAHHCSMSAEEAAALLNGQHFVAVRSRCPQYPTVVNATQHEWMSLDAAGMQFAEIVSHPALHRQTEAWARVALAGARQKRGPPAVRLS